MSGRQTTIAALSMTALVLLGLGLQDAGPILLDRSLTRSIQAASALDGVFRAFSAVGSPPGLAAIGGMAALAFAVRRRYAAVIAVVATASVEVLVLALRLVSDRPRPAEELVSVLGGAPGTSFPSGHAAATAALGVVIVAVLDVSARVRVAAAVLAGVVAAGAGISRIYLGVHWPTDVIAGWALGLVTGTVIIGRYPRSS